MASAFDADKHTGERSTLFDDLDQQPGGVKPAAAIPQQPGGFFQTVDDAVRAAADTASFGLLDRGLEASGLEPGAIARTQQARERSPWATTAGDVGGAVGTYMATPLRAVGAGISTALGGARAGLSGLAGRVLGYGAEGALTGAAQEAGHTYDLESLPENLKRGAAFGGAAGVVGGAITPSSSLRATPRAAVPTNQELGDLASGGYSAARANPHDVMYSGPATQAQANAAKQDLFSKNFYDKKAPATFEALDMPGQAQAAASRAAPHVSHSPMDIETIRQAANAASTPADITASKIAKQYIDDFTANPSFATLSRGTPAGAQATQEIIDTARANQAAKFRSDIVQKARDKTELSAAARDADVEKPMRAAIARVLASEGRSFNPAERAALESAAKRADRWAAVTEVGKILGSGRNVANQALGSGAAGAGLGYYSGGDIGSALTGAAVGGAVPWAAGRIVRGAGNRATRNAVNEADQLIRMRSPEFERRFAADPTMIPGLGAGAGSQGVRDVIADTMARRERPKITVRPDPKRYPQYYGR